MKLTETEVDKTYRVVSFQSGRKMQKRLFDMGLTSTCDFLVVVSSDAGPVLIEVRGTRLGIGRGMAEKIIVEAIS